MEILLVAAERDQQAFSRLAEDPNLHDSLAGFHAQQAVEKALKAVLAQAVVVFRRTHDIAELLDRLEDAGITSSLHAAHLDELTAYAIEMRDGPIEPSGLLDARCHPIVPRMTAIRTIESNRCVVAVLPDARQGWNFGI